MWRVSLLRVRNILIKLLLWEALTRRIDWVELHNGGESVDAGKQDTS